MARLLTHGLNTRANGKCRKAWYHLKKRKTESTRDSGQHILMPFAHVDRAAALVRCLADHWLFGVVVYFVVLAIWNIATTRKLDVPRVYIEDNTWLDRWTDCFRITLRAEEAVKKGYLNLPKSFFKIKLLHRTYVIVDQNHVKELIDAPESDVSFHYSERELLQLRYTFGESLANDHHHAHIIRTKLTRKIAELMPDITDELDAAFNDEFILGDGWISVPLFKKTLTIVARINNRIIMGLPLCRNKDYLHHAIEHTTNVARAAMVLQEMPQVVRPILVYLFRGLQIGKKAVYRHLFPIVQERKQLYSGDPEGGKPNDFLQWLLDKYTDANMDDLVQRVQFFNFASIHTTSLVHFFVLLKLTKNFASAMYYLAIYREYAEPIRKEIETIVASDGWTKAGLMKMHKLDSFLKESMRLSPLGAAGTTRVVMRDYTFSNGITIPKGTRICSPVLPIHKDESVYNHADQFEGFRFCNMRDRDHQSAKHNASHTSLDFLQFGHGQHAWFFAVNEIKLMMAFAILRFDIKTKDGRRPREFKFNWFTFPDSNAEILLRKRNADDN